MRMKSRCKRYPTYLEKDIRVCDEWIASYEEFRDWALKNNASPELELDRADNNGNYEPSNCRWITHAENCRNKGPRKKKNNLEVKAY